MYFCSVAPFNDLARVCCYITLSSKREWKAKKQKQNGFLLLVYVCTNNGVCSQLCVNSVMMERNTCCNYIYMSPVGLLMTNIAKDWGWQPCWSCDPVTSRSDRSRGLCVQQFVYHWGRTTNNRHPDHREREWESGEGTRGERYILRQLGKDKYNCLDIYLLLVPECVNLHYGNYQFQNPAASLAVWCRSNRRCLVLNQWGKTISFLSLVNRQSRDRNRRGITAIVSQMKQ